MLQENIKITSVKLERKGEKAVIGYRESSDKAGVDTAINGAISELVEEQRAHLRGGRRKSNK